MCSKLDWQEWGILAEITMATAAIVALALGVPSWIRTRRALKRELVNELYREYSSSEMGEAIHALYGAFRKSTGKQPSDDVSWADERKWVDHYKRLYERRKFDLHYQRRMVSAFYQRLAFSARGRFVKRTVLEMWGEKDHPMVMHLLLPIETVAMPELLSGVRITEPVPVFEYKYPMWRTAMFWRSAPPTRWWQFRVNWQRRKWERGREPDVIDEEPGPASSSAVDSARPRKEVRARDTRR